MLISSEDVSLQIFVLQDQLAVAKEEFELETFQLNEAIAEKDELIAQMRLELGALSDRCDQKIAENTRAIQGELEGANSRLEAARDRMWAMTQQIEHEKTEKATYMEKLDETKKAWFELKRNRSFTEMRLNMGQKELLKVEEKLEKSEAKLKRAQAKLKKKAIDDGQSIKSDATGSTMQNTPVEKIHRFHRQELHQLLEKAKEAGKCLVTCQKEYLRGLDRVRRDHKREAREEEREMERKKKGNVQTKDEEKIGTGSEVQIKNMKVVESDGSEVRSNSKLSIKRDTPESRVVTPVAKKIHEKKQALDFS